MFKKLLIASAVLAVSTSVAFAANYKGDYKSEAVPCPVYQYQTGPYVGLSVGDRTNYSATPTVFKGIDGILSVGYGAMLSDMFYLAGEAFGLGTINVKDMQYTQPDGSGDVGAKSSWGYGLSILPGVMITDHVLGYARLGAIRTRFNDQDVNKTGWQGGLGLQTNVYANWDLRVEYVYTGYGSVSGIGKVSSDQANLGIVYKFV